MFGKMASLRSRFKVRSKFGTDRAEVASGSTGTRMKSLAASALMQAVLNRGGQSIRT